MTRILLPLIALAACGGTPATESALTPPNPVPGSPSAETAPPAPVTPAAAAQAWTLQGVTHGDAACYVDLVKADGTSVVFPSDFRFCPGSPQDATPLIGKVVTATFEKVKILAAECQGDVDCGKSDEVEGVATLTAVP